MTGAAAAPEPVLWIDGAMVPAHAARVSPFDHGVTVGDGAFETFAVVDAGDGWYPIALDRHLARLRRSLAVLGLPLPCTDRELEAAVEAVVTANGGPGQAGGRVRITVTGGEAPLGSDRGTAPATVIVASGPASRWAPTAAAVVVPWTRNEHSATAGVKSTSYADNVVALRHAKAHGGDEAIFANTAGDLCEGTGSNVFVVLDGAVCTPPLSSGCLAGITRALVIEALADSPHPVREVAVPLADLGRATEVFLTSSTRDVHPVSTIDAHPIGTGAPGPITQQAAARYLAHPERAGTGAGAPRWQPARTP